MCIDGEVGVVQRREETPAPIDLGVILVDLGDDQKDRSQEQRQRESGDERIGRDIEDFEFLQIRDGLKDLLWELVQLWDIWGDRFTEVGAVADCLDDRKGHHLCDGGCCKSGKSWWALCGIIYTTTSRIDFSIILHDVIESRTVVKLMQS